MTTKSFQKKKSFGVVIGCSLSVTTTWGQIEGNLTFIKKDNADVFILNNIYIIQINFVIIYKLLYFLNTDHSFE